MEHFEVRLFASFAELFGAPHLKLTLPTGSTVAQLAAAVQSLPAGTALPRKLVVAVNQTYVTADTVTSLRYTAYSGMAEAELVRIREEMREQFGVTTAVIEHRLGFLDVGEISIGIAVAHEHRAPAMASVAYAIDEIKRRVPIWKEEEYADGTKEWVDPTAAGIAR